MHYEAPGFYKDAFNCPHCNAYASMKWNQLYTFKQGGSFEEVEAHSAKCDRCGQVSLWKGIRIAAPISLVRHQADNTEQFNIDSAAKSIQLYPSTSLAPMPNPDLPEDCLPDYQEARDIFARSPRGSAALLRLVVQKLCNQLGDPSETIDKNIKTFVQGGLPKVLQEALDTVRVVGNEAVHPGEMNVNDSPESVSTLFRLVNLIVEKMITEPRVFSDLYQSLPPKKLQGIEQRDKPKP